MCQVHADLVSATGLELELHQREIFVQLAHAVDRHRRLARGVPAHGVLLLDRGVLAEGDVDHVGQRLHLSVHHGEVSLLDAALLELSAEAPVGGVALGEDHDTRGVPVEPVHHARAGELVADAGEVAAGACLEVVSKSVDHRA